MKKLLIIAFAVALVTGMSSMAMALITGSAHDFSAADWNPTGEICRVCHVPHDHALDTRYYTNGLLWNHAVSEATYQLYDQAWSSTLDGTPIQPDGHSKLCLACHDGTVATDTFDSYAGGVKDITDWGNGRRIPYFDVDGTGNNDAGVQDLHGTHPISIDYNLADPQLNALDTPIGTSGTIEDVLEFGKLQCSGCHDVHNTEAVDGTPLLRVANSTSQGGDASGLCLVCHAK